MSYDLQRKRELAALADAAISRRSPGEAACHLARAAVHAQNLARVTNGRISLIYNEEAADLIDLAERLKACAIQGRRAASKNAAGPVDTRGGIGKSGGAGDSRFLVTERPTMTLDDVAGLGPAKDAFKRLVVNHFRAPQAFKEFRLRPGGGVLLYGPSGTGKTHLARGLAGSVDAAFLVADAAAIKSKWVGQSEKNMHALFDEASRHERCVLFIDEVHQLLARNGNQKIGTVDAFLVRADGFSRRNNCLLVVGATNTPWMLPPAVTRPGGGRLGHHVYVPLPDAEARAMIFSMQLKDVPRDDGLDVQALAERTEGYSGAEIAAVSDYAKHLAVDRLIATGQPQRVGAADVDAALRHVRPKTTAAEIERLLAWGGEGSSAGNPGNFGIGESDDDDDGEDDDDDGNDDGE